MNATPSKLLLMLLLPLTVVVGNAYAVERPNPSLEERVQAAELVVVVDDIEHLPKTSQEFSKFFRVKTRIAGVLKGQIEIGERIEVVVDNTISELKNDCCSSGQAYVLFLREKEGKYYFVGSPLGSIPLNLRTSSER